MKRNPTLRGAAARAAAIALASWASATQAAEPVWTYEQFNNPVAGVTVHEAKIASPDTGEPGIQMSVRCSSRNAYPEIRVFFDRDTLRDYESVEWQFDEAAPRSGRWTRSPNGRSLIFSGGRQNDFMRQLEAYHELKLTLILIEGRSQSFVIPLAGSSVAIARAVHQCR